MYGWNIDLRTVVNGEGSNKPEEVVRDRVIKELAGHAKKIWLLLSHDGKPLKILSKKMAF